MIFKNGKRLIVLFLLTVMISRFSICLYCAGAATVDMKKVDKFIEVVYNYIKTTLDPFGFEEEGNRDKLNKLIEQQNLTDDEYFEVQKKIAKQIDVAYYRENMMDLPEDKTEGAHKWLVYELAKSYPMEQWGKKMTKEQIIMIKIMPIIEKSSNEMKVEWLIILGNLLTDIHNQNLPFSDTNRAYVMDKLIELFLNTKNPIKLRVEATDAWTCGERRKQKITDGVNALLNDEKVFKEVGTLIWFLTNEAPNIYDKMFDVLKSRDKYSEDTVQGTLSFFRRECMGSETSEERNRIKQVKAILEEIVKKKKSDNITEQSQEILEMIAENEQEGRYK